MASTNIFEVGKIFSSIEEVKTAILEYNSLNYTDFVIRSNNSKSVYVECKHGRERKSESTGKRPKQHYNFLGCKAFIRLYKSKDGRIKVTKLILEHCNHPTTSEIYQHNHALLDEEDEELVLTLKDANAKPSQIKRVLAEKKISMSRRNEFEIL